MKRSTLNLRRRLRLTVALAAIALCLIPAGSALAATTLHVDQEAWFWASATDLSACEGQTTQIPTANGYCDNYSNSGGLNFPGQGAGVGVPTSPGHMLVGMKNGSPDARSYIHFDTSSIPFGAQVTSFIVTLSVSTPTDTKHDQEHATFAQGGGPGKSPATSNENAAIIEACAVTKPFGDNMGNGGGGDAPYSTSVDTGNAPGDEPTVKTSYNEPSSDCALSAQGAASSDGTTWTFDITKIAQAWFNPSSGLFNQGIALLPEPSGVSPTWQVEFHGRPLILANQQNQMVTYVTPAEQPQAHVEFTGGAQQACTTCSSGGGITPPVTPPFQEAPTLPVSQPTLPSQPTQTSPVTQPTVPLAFHGKTPMWLWILVPVGLLGAFLMEYAVGEDALADRLAPVGVSNRVANLLRLRRLSGVRATSAAAVIEAEEANQT